MAKVDSNTAALAYVREADAGTTPGTAAARAAWKALEPNEVTTFGATIATTPREPISNRLQRRKGAVTDLDSTAAFGADLTVDGLLDWLEAAIFAVSVNRDARDLPVSAVVAADGYTVGAIFAGAAGTEGADRRAKFAATTLVWGDSFANSGNNGLKLLSAAAMAADDNLDFINAVTEATGGYVSLAGARLAGKASAEWAWVAADGRATLTYAAHGLSTARGLYPGMMVHFGSVANRGDTVDDLQNGLKEAATDAIFGFARVVSIAAGAIVFDRVSDGLKGAAGANLTVDLSTIANLTDICFGDFFRNVAVDHDDYSEIGHSIELVSPNLGDGTPGSVVTRYEYAVGQRVGPLVLTFPLTDKATMTVNFVGQDTGSPRARHPGVPAVGPAAPRRTEPFNTTSDFARLTIEDVDGTGITTDFKSLTITIDPQISPEKVLGTLGARFVNRGNLLVDSEAQVIFSSPNVIDAIRENATLSMNCIIGNSDGVFAFDIPSQTLGGGGREYPVNAAVLVNTTGAGFEDAELGTSIGVSFFPVPVPAAIE